MTANETIAPQRSGVYRTPPDADALRDRARAQDLAWLEADCARVRSKPALLDAIAAAADFPAWFGHNWDALADSLRDFSWCPAAGYVLRLRDTGAARQALAAEWPTLIAVLNEVSCDWKARGKPFVAFVDGAAELPAWT